MKECKWCGTPFDNSGKGLAQKVYCCIECYKASNRENAKKNSKPKQIVEKECTCCGKKFTQNGHKQVYCSPECRKEMRRSTEKAKRQSKPKTKKKGSNLRDLNREAMQHGMSYGKYVAMLEGGMK